MMVGPRDIVFKLATIAAVGVALGCGGGSDASDGPRADSASDRSHREKEALRFGPEDRPLFVERDGKFVAPNGRAQYCVFAGYGREGPGGCGFYVGKRRPIDAYTDRLDCKHVAVLGVVIPRARRIVAVTEGERELAPATAVRGLRHARFFGVQVNDYDKIERLTVIGRDGTTIARRRNLRPPNDIRCASE